MDLIDYEHTKLSYIKKIYSLYLQGFSEHEIAIKLREHPDRISNIITCHNYLNI